MKKTITLVLAALLCTFFTGSPAWAEDDAFGFNVGLRTWYNEWEIKPKSGGGETSDYTFMVGPNFKVSYGKFFCGASFLASVSDYKFTVVKWPRYDLDAMIGYMVHPRLGLVAGWKYIRGTSNTGTSHSIYGPTFGATFNYPIPIEVMSLAFYLNGAFLPLQGNIKSAGAPNDVSYDIIGYSAEAGFAYAPMDKLSISLGYKYQNLDWRDLASDILSGVTLGVNYAF